MYWRLISRVRRQVGRRPISKEVRELIRVSDDLKQSFREHFTHGLDVEDGLDLFPALFVAARLNEAHIGRRKPHRSAELYVWGDDGLHVDIDHPPNHRGRFR
jgi:hypothetical protein